MKLVVFGHKERASRCLDYLLSNGFRVACLVSPKNVSLEDKARRVAAQNNIQTITWTHDQHEMHNELEKFNADLFIVSGFPHILKTPLIKAPRIGAINLHGGKLPEYRGSSPINWALINGETTITISVLELTEEIDAGDIIGELSLDLKNTDNAKTVLDWALDQFPKLLLTALNKIKQDGKICGTKQPVLGARYFPLRTPDDGFISFETMTAQTILNFIRGLAPPFPGAFSIMDGRRVFFTKAEKLKIEFLGVPGKVYSVKGLGLVIMAKDSGLKIINARFDDILKGPFFSVQNGLSKRFQPYLKE